MALQVCPGMHTHTPLPFCPSALVGRGCPLDIHVGKRRMYAPVVSMGSLVTFNSCVMLGCLLTRSNQVAACLPACPAGLSVCLSVCLAGCLSVRLKQMALSRWPACMTAIKQQTRVIHLIALCRQSAGELRAHAARPILDASHH